MIVQTNNISRAIQEQSEGSRFIIEVTERGKKLSGQEVSHKRAEERQQSDCPCYRKVSDKASKIAGAPAGKRKKASGLSGHWKRC